MNIDGTALKVFFQEHKAWLLDDDFTGVTVDGAVRQDYCNRDRGRCEYR